MAKIAGLVLILIGASQFGVAVGPAAAPEIGAESGVAALALLSGALLVIRGRRTK